MWADSTDRVKNKAKLSIVALTITIQGLGTCTANPFKKHDRIKGSGWDKMRQNTLSGSLERHYIRREDRRNMHPLL